MNFKKCYIITILLSFWLLWYPASVFAEEPIIKWYSYQEGVEKIKKENKKGFMHFYTDWCGYCKLMNKSTFTDKKVIAFLNENFVPILVNAEKQQDVAKNYNVSKFPYTFFIAEDVSSIGSRPGYIPPDVMMDMLLYINSNTFQKMSFNDYMEKKRINQTGPSPEPKM